MYIIFPSSLSPRVCGVSEKRVLFSVEEVEGCFFFSYYCCYWLLHTFVTIINNATHLHPTLFLLMTCIFPILALASFSPPILRLVPNKSQHLNNKTKNNFDINIDKTHDIHTHMMSIPLLVFFFWGFEICVWWGFVWGYMDFRWNVYYVVVIIICCLLFYGWTIENCWWIRTKWGDIQTPACCVVH